MPAFQVRAEGDISYAVLHINNDLRYLLKSGEEEKEEYEEMIFIIPILTVNICSDLSNLTLSLITHLIYLKCMILELSTAE